MRGLSQSPLSPAASSHLFWRLRFTRKTARLVGSLKKSHNCLYNFDARAALANSGARAGAVSVTRGPIQPVAQEGELNEEPVGGAVVLVRASSGGSAEAVTGADGTAVLRLLPGSYRVAVTECPGALTLPGDAQVIVTEGRMESVALSCDTGIR